MQATFYTKTKQDKSHVLSPYQENSKPTGRPLFDGKNEHEVVAKLQHAFSVGASVKEACILASISTDSYYRYCKKNPEFRDINEALQIMPILQAKMIVVNAIYNGNANLAWKYLVTHSPEEFSHSGSVQRILREQSERIEYLEEVLRDKEIPFDY